VNAAVEAEGLVKTYGSRSGTVEAVRGVDLEVAAGEVFGLRSLILVDMAWETILLGFLVVVVAGVAVVALSVRVIRRYD
jgi:ABC-2 type transport system ATP-binding protein